jgi:hypothetical protein
MSSLLKPALLSLVVSLLLAGSASRPSSAEEPSTKSAAEPAKPDASSPITWPPGRVIFEQSDAEKELRAAIEKPARFDFSDTPLGDVADRIEKEFGIHVELDVEALAADGKGSDLPLTKKGQYTSLCNGLRLVLDGQGLAFLVKHDVLLITTKTAASAPENQSTRLYQVHDLVVMPNDPMASQPDFDSLIELMTSTIRPQDWQDNGGTIGFVKSFQGPGVLALIATHDEQGHGEIEQLLKMLRQARLPQIAEAQARQPLPPPEKQQPFVYGAGGISPLPAATNTPTGETTPPAAAESTTPAKKSGGGMF